MISSVAELYKLHPQTLRLYERVGLLKPSRSQGNTRLYTDLSTHQICSTNNRSIIDEHYRTRNSGSRLLTSNRV